jgi:competence protein ComEC
VLCCCAVALAVARPSRLPGTLAWLALVAFAGAACGLVLGTARLGAIDAGALRARPGSELSARGYVTAVPRRSDGEVWIRVATGGGRLAIVTPEPVAELPVGAEVKASGRITAPPPWLEGMLGLHGIGRVLRAAHIELTGARRSGVAGRIDGIRTRAEAALGRGMPEAQAALARGFVLGQDDRISASTIEAFRRSGLAHLLAVSGQNVLLLVLLAAPLLAVLAIPLRARLVWLLALIAVYVPLAGAGASIQRAGVMGAAALVATLAGRPASRLYAVLLAVAVTLALNPRAGADVGWQLSFAAVLGIFLWTRPLREGLLARIGGAGWRRAAVDGVAVTLAATAATAPLMAHHFEQLSVTSPVANLLALPAVAPAMWLGMAVAALGQLPAIPVEPLNWVNSLLLAYIAQIAEWMAGPAWAQLGLSLAGWKEVFAVYALLLAISVVARRWSEARRGLRAAPRPRTLRASRAALAVLLVALAIAIAPFGAGAGPPAPAGLRISVLDVGQGDSILLQPDDGLPLLIDAGPPGTEMRGMLAERGVESLAAVLVTHDEADHSGGLAELLESLPVRRLAYAGAGRSLLARARAAGATPLRVAEGTELRSGSLRLEVLWPPRERLVGGADDPNSQSLVLLARWRGFEMLLTGDAEAEAVPIDPGPVDVLKVAHHGSADAGLGALLNRSAPRLAVISVGEGNPFGHPVPATLATLRAHRVAVSRTDLDGTVTIEVAPGGASFAIRR